MKLLNVLRLEWLALFIVSLMAYETLGSLDWKWFIPIWLAFDLSMIGYIFGSRIGAIVYNIGHSLVTAYAVLVLAVLLESDVWEAVIAAWVAHISLDRFLGYGLKTPEGFKHTHLGIIGGASSAKSAGAAQKKKKK